MQRWLEPFSIAHSARKRLARFRRRKHGVKTSGFVSWISTVSSWSTTKPEVLQRPVGYMETKTALVVIVLSVAIGLVAGADAATSSNPATARTPQQQPASTDVEFLQQAGQASEAEMALAALAQKQSSDARIKSLADVLKRDHEAARTELQTLAKLKKAELTGMTVAQLATHSRLEKIPGRDFDRAWVEAIIELHRDARGLFSRASRSADPDVKAFAGLQAKVLEEHLKRAKELQGEVYATLLRGAQHETPALQCNRRSRVTGGASRAALPV
jgi:putative membrane protein